jgi:hypothetical protein
MKLVDILTKAQMISSVGVFEGNAIDQNGMAMSLSVFHQTLNHINNDPKTTLWQEELNYQTYNDLPSRQAAVPPGGWLDLPEPPSEPEQEIESKFPEGTQMPFAISRSYPLPNDCRRVIKAMSASTELRKTDYSEVIRARVVPSYLNMFSVNNRKIELITPGKLYITYAKEFPEFMPQDEVTLPQESLDYVINLLAYNLALAFQRDSVDRCRILAEKSYNSLAGNLTVNHGAVYQNVYTAMNRFSGRGGAWL